MSNSNLFVAIQACLLAGREIMSVYNSKIEVFTKQDDSPLTNADRNANAVIVSLLEKTGIPIISEENKQDSYSQRKNWNQCWIVDPLDGTKEFIKRNGEFTVNIALVLKGAPVLGVIYVPVTKELYYANVQENTAMKATLESHEANVEQVIELANPIAPKDSPDTFRIVGSRSHLSQETQDFIDAIDTKKNKEIVAKGSSLKFCLVAEGKADVYPRYAPTMEWDTAAGQAICEAVGVQVLALPDYTPLRYNREDLLNPWFLVAKK